MYILQGGVRWYANCGFSHRSSMSFGQERAPKSAPTTCTKPLYCIFKKMTKAEKLNTIPVSGEYEEIIFDLPEPWRGQSWNFVKFTLSDGTNWCGQFREKDKGNFHIADLPDKGIACVVSGGHGYIVDIDKKEKIKDLNTEPLIDIYADKETNIFYVASWWSMHFIDENFNEIDMPIPIGCDGIQFKEATNRTLGLEIEEIGADMIKNNDYYIDLIKREIKKNAV